MTLKEVLTKAVEIINNGLIDLDTTSTERSRLIDCGRYIYAEVADEYVDLNATQELSTTDGKILFSSFAKPVKKIVRVTDNCIDVPFCLYPDHITVDYAGTFVVDYAYKSVVPDLNDTLDLPAEFTPYALASGVASEYFFRTGLIEEALFYKNRYDRAISNLTQNRRTSYLKIRRFV